MARLILNRADADTAIDPQAIGRELKKAINALKAGYYDPAHGGVDYARLRRSPAFAEYARIACALQRFDLHALARREQKLAFWINIYNSLVVHGIVELGLEDSVKDFGAFFGSVCYAIGGYDFSLDEIEHGILRGNRKKHLLSFRPFGDADPRRQFIVATLDPRIHFALVCGSKSCPPIGVYQEEAIDRQLDAAAANFIGSDVEVDTAHARIRASRVFQWYRKDFGDNADLVRFIARYREDPAERAWLEQNAGRVVVEYLDYDWSLNHIPTA